MSIIYRQAISLLMYDRILACYEELYTIWDHLFYILVELIIYQERQWLGILNPNTLLFYPFNKVKDNAKPNIITKK